jgi:hypothetical protein
MQLSEGRAMTAKITSDVLEAHARCKYKAHLKLAGEQGTQSDYEALLTQRRDDVRQGRCVTVYRTGQSVSLDTENTISWDFGRPMPLAWP